MKSKTPNTFKPGKMSTMVHGWLCWPVTTTVLAVVLVAIFVIMIAPAVTVNAASAPGAVQGRQPDVPIQSAFPIAHGQSNPPDAKVYNDRHQH